MIDFDQLRARIFYSDGRLLINNWYLSKTVFNYLRFSHGLYTDRVQAISFTQIISIIAVLCSNSFFLSRDSSSNLRSTVFFKKKIVCNQNTTERYLVKLQASNFGIKIPFFTQVRNFLIPTKFTLLYIFFFLSVFLDIICHWFTYKCG